MAVSISRNVIENIKDELRNQVRLWNYQLMHDSEMNEHFKSSLENTLEKSKIIQRIRLEHIDRLLNKIETGNKYREEIINEIQAYWEALLPDIKNVFNTFHRINIERNFYDEIEKLEIPEKLQFQAEIHQEPQPTSQSTQNKTTTSQSITRRKSTYSSFSTITTVTSASRARPQIRSRRVNR